MKVKAFHWGGSVDAGGTIKLGTYNFANVVKITVVIHVDGASTACRLSKIHFYKAGTTEKALPSVCCSDRQNAEDVIFLYALQTGGLDLDPGAGDSLDFGVVKGRVSRHNDTDNIYSSLTVFSASYDGDVDIVFENADGANAISVFNLDVVIQEV